jgi:hypothetical protein
MTPPHDQLDQVTQLATQLVSLLAVVRETGRRGELVLKVTIAPDQALSVAVVEATVGADPEAGR